MYSLVHHLDQPTPQPTKPCSCAGLSPRTPDRVDGIHTPRPRSSQRTPGRADRSHTPPTHTTQPFSCLLSHFAKASVIFQFRSVILLQCTQSFWYSELNHFAIVKLSHFVILSVIFATLNSVIFAIVLSHFFIATILSHSSFMQCSVIF
jgi:hypothetical protein